MPWTPALPAAFLLFLLFQGTPAQKDVTQEPAILMVNEGESVNITCSVTTKGTLVGMYLKKEVVNAMEVLYITNNGRTRTIDFRYKDRIEISVLQTDVWITLHQLQKNDTGLYVCRESVLENYEPNCVSSQGTILVVKEMEQAECHMASWMPYVLSFMALILVSALGYLILSHIDIKKHCQEGKEKQANIVYEDMSYTLRLNNLATVNPYNNC
ncbi:T-cell antigen CD7 [Trachemys scripta elegans]|uniref:T-cell antigen CD7 n=1 Tax=Trachemys scripta elegans TaxID=31138 RepID=UPI0015556245|nr:T-cell antigen CD7 [Trachemys scripta elegans]